MTHVKRPETVVALVATLIVSALVAVTLASAIQSVLNCQKRRYPDKHSVVVFERELEIKENRTWENK